MGAELDPEQLQRGLRGPRSEILYWLKSMPNMEFIEIDYPTLVRYPRPVIDRVVKFLGVDRLPNSAEMAKVIDPSLHRKKSN